MLKSVIKEKRLGKENTLNLDVLEASSYGYASMGQAYLDLMKDAGANIICSDYYENAFKAIIKEDMAKLSFEDESLDIICHSHVLEHVEDDVEAMKEAYRCLRPGGAFLFAVPIQTDQTFSPKDEYHGDNAYVYRRNGWDIIGKLKAQGFHVEVRVPQMHTALDPERVVSPEQLVLDNISYQEKFSANYKKYIQLFYPAMEASLSNANRYSSIWGQLEIFVATRSLLM